MKILITGAAGFVGSKMVEYFYSIDKAIDLIGIDNLSRKGSEFNVEKLKIFNLNFYKGDISFQKDVDALPKVDWIIDCAANPSVLAGLKDDSLQLINDNLIGTFYLLEKCKRDNAGFIMLSTSRVYSINELNKISFLIKDDSFLIDINTKLPNGVTEQGISESFSTESPVSLYGATKLSSEIMALEYQYSFGFPVWVNRCGVIAGAGQFGKIDQGIFSFWIYQYLLDKPLSFIGFGGKGFQVRDMVHPRDVFSLIQKQIFSQKSGAPLKLNIGGGIENSMSLFQLDKFCKKTINSNKRINQIVENRNFDIPLYITDYSAAKFYWNWEPSVNCESILEEILFYAKNNLDFIKQIN